jgi:hypothetical protein
VGKQKSKSNKVIFTSYKSRGSEFREQSLVINSQNSFKSSSKSDYSSSSDDFSKNNPLPLPPLSYLFMQLDLIGSLLIKAVVSTRHIGFIYLFY